ncbi:MAG: hydroxymethylglutaryl-CoA lyase, partial [Acidimicrobiia bacterium]|nr:hydroxymethylglutaryl-CoA lyase [Acidimicrobiia bacterium]
KLLSDTRPVRVNLGDTIGVAVPSDVIDRFRAVGPYIEPSTARGAHFHNTRNTGYANAYAALTVGVTHFDASVGGIGGCPFAPNATGNVATEDLGYLFERMGFDTGLNLETLMGTSRWLEGPLGKSMPALLGRAGLFPITPSESGSAPAGPLR